MKKKTFTLALKLKISVIMFSDAVEELVKRLKGCFVLVGKGLMNVKSICACICSI